jgi:hypothetical protein
MDAYVSKPIRASELFAEIDTITSRLGTISHSPR